MMKTKEGMEAGLALLGLRVKELTYEPGKILKVDDHDLHQKINNLIRSFLNFGALEDFQLGLTSLRNMLDGDVVHGQTTASEARSELKTVGREPISGDGPDDDVLEL